MILLPKLNPTKISRSEAQSGLNVDNFNEFPQDINNVAISQADWFF
jgi:hypothetical protein